MDDYDTIFVFLKSMQVLIEIGMELDNLNAPCNVQLQNYA